MNRASISGMTGQEGSHLAKVLRVAITSFQALVRLETRGDMQPGEREATSAAVPAAA
ncbi:MAG TPA: hypothetical protein VEB19_02400 [Gemmatimonadaceae bacterium]|nr:hypothetical protein [Gemmatimonadaceae bacterium]